MPRLRVGPAEFASILAILAGCSAGGPLFHEGPAGIAHPLAPVALEAAVEDAPGLEEQEALPLDSRLLPPWWRMGLVGAEFGLYSLVDDDLGTWFDDAAYAGVKLAWEPGLNWGLSVSVGRYRAENLSEGGEDIEVFPVRATLELGGLMFFTQSRWFVGGGGGYAFMDDLPSGDKIDLWPAVGVHLDREWTAHVVAGFELRNESIIALRLEGGQCWFLESEADVQMVTATLSLQY